LRDTHILLMASQCWDDDLRSRVQKKLEVELPTDATVIDYTKCLSQSSEFEEVAVVEGQVSWNNKQGFYIYAKRKESDKALD